ncbi:hypothetical protein MASR1M45_03180 [Candidatus Kapaibacterium sp.]
MKKTKLIKYILLLLISTGISNAQTFKDVIKGITENNKSIKAYTEYLNGVHLDAKVNTFLPNPKAEYSYMSGSNSGIGSKKEFSISQTFEFPSVYYLKSGLSDIQKKINQNLENAFTREVILNSGHVLIDYIYQSKLVDELTKRVAYADTIYKAVEKKYNLGEAGILELNKSKSALNLAKSKLNIAKTEIISLKSSLENLNGGNKLNLTGIDYWLPGFITNFDSLFTILKGADYSLKSLQEEKQLSLQKLSIAKSGWLPGFDIGYIQEDDENNFNFKGARIGLSIPLFENSNKVPKAESELNLYELNIQNYLTEFQIKKRNLYDKSFQLNSALQEQKSLMDFGQLELNRKSFELGHISLTQYYIDNSMYFDIIDSMLEIEKEYYKVSFELIIEII